jgi:uncharacterized protein with LGFP repeats
MNKLVLLALTALVIGGCAPAARQQPSQSPNARAQAAQERFTVKTGEVWTMTAYLPGSTQNSRFPLELYGAPEVNDGYLIADAESGTRDATLVYDPDDDSLFVGLLLNAERDPDVVFCNFNAAQAGKSAYNGESFYGKLSEVQSDERIPDSRFGRCTLEKR